MSVNRGDHAARLFQADLMKDIEMISDIRGPKQNVLGHGVLLYENQAGGRVAITPWSVSQEVVMNVQRHAQISKVINYLARDSITGYVTGGAWLVPQLLTDGSIYRGVVWNANPDSTDTFDIHVPQGISFTSAMHITAAGEFLNAKINGKQVKCAAPLQQWEFVVLK